MAGKAKGDFGTGSVPKLLIKLALPIIAAEIVHVLYSIVDRIFIGHMPGVGTAALTGVGIVVPLVTMIGGFANLFATGGATLASIARGEGDNERAERLQTTSFTATIAVGILLTILLYVFAPGALTLMGGDEETLPYALAYFRIYVIGVVPTLISLGMNNFITNQGFAGIGMWTVIIGAGLNTILDPIFIFVLNLGIKGAAYATIISQFVSAIWIVLFLTSKKPIIRITRLYIDWGMLKQICKLGVTGFTFRVTTSFAQAVVNATLKAFGGPMSTLYIGAMSVINSLREVTIIPIQGLGNAYVPVASYNYGAKKWARLDEAIKCSILGTFAINLLLWLILMVFSSQCASLFTEDAELIALTAHCIRIFFAAFLFMTCQTAGQNTYVALNYPKYALFFSLLRKIVLVVPFTLLLPRIGMGVEGVFYAELLSNVVGGTAAIITMYIVVWSKVKKLAKGDTSVEV